MTDKSYPPVANTTMLFAAVVIDPIDNKLISYRDRGRFAPPWTLVSNFEEGTFFADEKSASTVAAGYSEETGVRTVVIGYTAIFIDSGRVMNGFGPSEPGEILDAVVNNPPLTEKKSKAVAVTEKAVTTVSIAPYELRVYIEGVSKSQLEAIAVEYNEKYGSRNRLARVVLEMYEGRNGVPLIAYGNGKPLKMRPEDFCLSVDEEFEAIVQSGNWRKKVKPNRNTKTTMKKVKGSNLPK